MKPRTLIILGVVIVVVFVVGIGAGVGSGQGSSVNLNDVKNASWRSSLDQALTRKLDPVHDLVFQSGAGCTVQAAQIAISVGATCVYQIGSTFIPLNRRLILTLLDSAQVRFALDQPDSLPTRPEPTGQTVSMDIYKSGGTLTMTCQSASSGTCTMQVD